MGLADLVASLLSSTKTSSWRDRMGPAKFRGHEFYVERSERTGGRRTVSHEYPGKNDPYVEDMGRKARTFPVEGYVLGDGYMDTLERLLAALEQAGPGELVHPYHGKRSVIVTSYRVTETKDAGGIAQLSIEFAETPTQQAQPSAVEDGASVLKASASKSLLAASTDFLSKYSAGTLLSSVSNQLRSATLAMNNIASAITSGPDELAAFKRRVENFESAIDSLVSAPSDMVAGIVDLFSFFTSRSAATKLYSFSPGVRPPATTPARVQEQTNFDATQALIQRVALAQATTLVADESFASYDDAKAAAAELSDLIDEQANNADDATYSALVQLRADLNKGVPGDSEELPRLQPYTPHVTTPSLVLAYQLYNDLERESDLLDRNKIVHPGFVTADKELEVLTSG